MAGRIYFRYNDGRVIGVGFDTKKLPLSSAKEYQKRFTRPDNDGGMVYTSPYRLPPIPLSDYITNFKATKAVKVPV